jgi:hypothetical protein
MSRTALERTCGASRYGSKTISDQLAVRQAIGASPYRKEVYLFSGPGSTVTNRSVAN